MTRMSIEMAEDMGLIPEVSPYQVFWYGDKYKTNEQYMRTKRRLWSPFDYDEKTGTVEVKE